MRLLDLTVHVAYLAVYGRHLEETRTLGEAEKEVRASFPKLMHYVYRLVENHGATQREDETDQEFHRRLAHLFLSKHKVHSTLQPGG